MSAHPTSPSQSDAVELLPCAHCGGEAAFGTVRYSDKTITEQNWGQDTFHYVNCIVCGVNNRGLVGHRTVDKARTAWNRRSPDLVPALAQSVEMARDARRWRAFLSLVDTRRWAVRGWTGDSWYGNADAIRENVDAALAEEKQRG